MGECDVLRDRHLRDDAVVGAVFGDEADARAGVGRGASPRRELTLAVAGDAYDGEDFAATRRGCGERGDGERMRVSFCSPLSLAPHLSHASPSHSRDLARPSSKGESATIEPRRMTTTRLATVVTSRILWVMKTIAVPFRGERPHDGEQLLRLVGGEHGGRLVEDQQRRLARDRFDELELCLLADGEIAGAALDVGERDTGRRDDRFGVPWRRNAWRARGSQRW